ncbi:MAG: glycosyltransferase family 4 protein [Bacteroidetes bacterium]|nr:glycosyltransferase family 4 protein [Bacteroidota bacterium]
MKIAFLTSEYPHVKAKFAAGIGTSILNLANGLMQAGHEVTVILYGQDSDETFAENGITFYKIKNRRLKGFSWQLTQKKIQKLIRTLVDSGKIDIVEVADWTGISSNIQLNCPLVVKLHGSDTYFCHLDHRPVKKINHSRERKALMQANAWSAVSNYVAQTTQKLFQLNRDFEVIPNGIDLNRFSIQEQTAEDDTQKILYFGTLIRKKGLLELPLIFNEVHRQNNQAQLILIGRDSPDIKTHNESTWQMMQELFDADAKANVSYLGSVPYDEIKEYIEASSVCVFPTFAEALPVSWLEAMAMQKAIVASDIGWAAEIIDHGVDGFLVHPQQHQIFAQHINELLKNQAFRTEIGLKARAKVVQKFSKEVVAEHNAAFYEKVLKAYKARKR